MAITPIVQGQKAFISPSERANEQVTISPISVVPSQIIQKTIRDIHDKGQNYLFKIYPHLTIHTCSHQALTLKSDSPGGTLSFLVSLEGLVKISSVYMQYRARLQQMKNESLYWACSKPDGIPYYYHPRAIAQVVLFTWLKEENFASFPYRKLHEQSDVPVVMVKDLLLLSRSYKIHALADQCVEYLLHDMSANEARLREYSEVFFEVPLDSLTPGLDWKRMFLHHQSSEIKIDILRAFASVFHSHPYLLNDLKVKDEMWKIFESAAQSLLSSFSTFDVLEKIGKTYFDMNLIEYSPHSLLINCLRITYNSRLWHMWKGRLAEYTPTHTTPGIILMNVILNFNETSNAMRILREIREHEKQYSSWMRIIQALEDSFSIDLNQAPVLNQPQVSPHIGFLTVSHGVIEDDSYDLVKTNHLVEYFPHLRNLPQLRITGGMFPVLIEVPIQPKMPSVRFIVPKKALVMASPFFRRLFLSEFDWQEKRNNTLKWGGGYLPNGGIDFYHPEACAYVLLYMLKLSEYAPQHFNPPQPSLEVFIDVARLGHLFEIKGLQDHWRAYVSRLRPQHEEELIELFNSISSFPENFDCRGEWGAVFSRFTERMPIQESYALLIKLGLGISDTFSLSGREGYIRFAFNFLLNRHPISSDNLQIICKTLLMLNPSLQLPVDGIDLSNLKAYLLQLPVNCGCQEAMLLKAYVEYWNRDGQIITTVTQILLQESAYTDYCDLVLIMQGLAEMYQENWDSALAYFNRESLRMSGRQILLIMLKGICQYERYEYTKAIQLMSDLLMHHPHQSDCLAIRGACKLMLKQYEEALFDLAESTRISLDSPLAWAYLGLYEIIRNDFDSAAENYLMAIKQDKDVCSLTKDLFPEASYNLTQLSQSKDALIAQLKLRLTDENKLLHFRFHVRR